LGTASKKPPPAAKEDVTEVVGLGLVKFARSEKADGFAWGCVVLLGDILRELNASRPPKPED
jgi:hypothetical protein